MRGTLFTIGQTATLCMTSIQTLRFYDKIGLVRPAVTEDHNGYRFYFSRDILLIKIVQDLRAMQFSLKEIKEMLEGDIKGQIAGRMRQKKEEALAAIASLETTVSLIDQRMERMLVQQQLRYDFEHHDYLIEMKQLPPRFIAYERKRSACGMETYILRITELFNRLQE